MQVLYAVRLLIFFISKSEGINARSLYYEIVIFFISKSGDINAVTNCFKTGLSSPLVIMWVVLGHFVL